MIFASVMLALLLLAFTWMIWIARRAPAGYEDKRGWHEGREPEPGTDADFAEGNVDATMRPRGPGLSNTVP